MVREGGGDQAWGVLSKNALKTQQYSFPNSNKKNIHNYTYYKIRHLIMSVDREIELIVDTYEGRHIPLLPLSELGTWCQYYNKGGKKIGRKMITIL